MGEALAIKEAYGNSSILVMNAKTGYSRCVLPGITVPASEVEKQEDERVKSLILELRKRRGLPEEKMTSGAEESQDDDDKQMSTDNEPGSFRSKIPNFLREEAEKLAQMEVTKTISDFGAYLAEPVFALGDQEGRKY